MSEMQQLTYGLIVTLVGMGIVFIVLIGLAYMLDALKLLSNRGTAEKKTEIVKVEKVAEPAEAISTPAEDEGELMAVISAALAAFMGSSSNLVVRSINRVEGNAPVWAKVGRQEQMFNRL
ncbi:MAG: OadG family protein [Lutispora sp.]|nr:OadG family protein [Lutispora sp.]MDD4833442.1 OadG family protein [Lutispora sp.]